MADLRDITNPVKLYPIVNAWFFFKLVILRLFGLLPASGTSLGTFCLETFVILKAVALFYIKCFITIGNTLVRRIPFISHVLTRQAHSSDAMRLIYTL